MSAESGPPDVLGLPLRDALVCLKASGWSVSESKKTCAPRAGGQAAEGLERVVRVRSAGDKAVSLVYVSTHGLLR